MEILDLIKNRTTRGRRSPDEQTGGIRTLHPTRIFGPGLSYSPKWLVREHYFRKSMYKIAKGPSTLPIVLLMIKFLDYNTVESWVLDCFFKTISHQIVTNIQRMILRIFPKFLRCLWFLQPYMYMYVNCEEVIVTSYKCLWRKSKTPVQHLAKQTAGICIYHIMEV